MSDSSTPERVDNAHSSLAKLGLPKLTVLITDLMPAHLHCLPEGGAVLEGRHLEGVTDHVDVLAGHEDNKEADDGEDGFAIGPGADDGGEGPADEGHGETTA